MEEEEQRHHFFWGVESFCIPRILSSNSEMKSYGETGGTKHMRGIQNQTHPQCIDVGCKVSGGRRMEERENLTSVGLKQSTSKSCKTNKIVGIGISI